MALSLALLLYYIFIPFISGLPSSPSAFLLLATSVPTYLPTYLPTAKNMSSAKATSSQSHHHSPESEVDTGAPKDVECRPHFARLNSTLPLNHLSHASPLPLPEQGPQSNQSSYFCAHLHSHARMPKTTQYRYSEFERDHDDDDEDSFPAGFPYNSWYGLWCLASEYLRRMQLLVSECMEGNGRYGGIRHTT